MSIIKPRTRFFPPQRSGNAPLSLIIFPYIIILLIYYFGPINYGPLSPRTLLYFAFALVGLVFGYKLGWRLPVKPRRSIINENIFRITTLLALIGDAGVMYDYNSAGMTFTSAFSNPIDNRVAAASQSTTLITTICYPFATLSYMAFLISLLRLNRGRRDSWTALSAMGILMTICLSMLQAARGPILLVAILLASFYAIKGTGKGHWVLKSILNRRTLKPSLIFVVVLSGMLFYGLHIGANRHADNSANEAIISAMAPDDSRLSWQFIQSTISNVGARAAVIGMLYYYSHQYGELNAIIMGDISPVGYGRCVLWWPLFELSRTGLDLAVKSRPSLEARELAGGNMSGFDTGFAAPLDDFGYVGSIIFVIVMAVIMGHYVKSACTGLSEPDICIAVWIVVYFIWGIHTFSNDGLLFINLLCAFGLKLQRHFVQTNSADNCAGA